MSDAIKHECGIALLRLLKPLDHYKEKYGSLTYGLNKLYLLMEKQHNRGQDGAGMGVIKLDPRPGNEYISRVRSIENQPIKDIFGKVYGEINQLLEDHPQLSINADWLKEHSSYFGELYLGHLRYGTHGINSISRCHPFHRANNWQTRNLVMAGNFNLTNVNELFDQLVELGQHPKERSDTVTVLEKIGHFLDTEVQEIFNRYKDQGYSNKDITDCIIADLSVKRILKRSSSNFDGGYAMAGMIGHGDAFVLRDPNGIRPAFYYFDEEIAVVASERPSIQTTFNVDISKVQELPPGHAIIIKKSGKIELEQILKPREKRSCSFERIYFSRGTDADIYAERKNLGYRLTPSILDSVDHDYENTLFSFIPNTAEVAFYGMMKGLEEQLSIHKRQQIEGNPDLKGKDLENLLNLRPRVEKIAVKDVKMRTFITQDSSRSEMVSHVYDITYGCVVPNRDTLVVIDDSIVRGTTLQQSILSILDRLNPKKIIIVSSAPQIRYPDCYGIDMSKMNDFIAFRAAIALVKEKGMDDLLDDIYDRCRADADKPDNEIQNQVKRLYESFDYEEISDKCAELLRPQHMFSDVKIIFQTIEDLHLACPDHKGDWYFTGDYPTAGGIRVVNQAFSNFMEGKNVRAYL